MKLISDLSLKLPSPLEPILLPSSDDQNLSFYIKRDELIHPEISGNKFRKLKHYLLSALAEKKGPIITFGGAFSNHIHACAAACKKLNLKSIGIIRGEYAEFHNPTLAFAIDQGMELIKIPILEYRKKTESEVIKKIFDQNPNHLLIPEGGNGPLGTLGVKDMVEEINMQMAPDYIVVSAGTGTTAAGIINQAHPSTKIVVVNALKNQNLKQEIQCLLTIENPNFEILHNYHRGGFAKVDQVLIDYIYGFYMQHTIKLEPIYTAKLMMAVAHLISKKYFKENSKIVIIHTGGLQGIKAHNYRYTNRKKMIIDI